MTRYMARHTHRITITTRPTHTGSYRRYDIAVTATDNRAALAIVYRLPLSVDYSTAQVEVMRIEQDAIRTAA